MFSAPIPLIGSQLASLAETSGGRIAQDLSAALASFATANAASTAVSSADITTGLQDVLGPPLQSRPIVVTSDAANSHVSFALTLTGNALDTVDLDLGAWAATPCLPLNWA